MNADELRKWACNILKTVLQAKAPYDTGNLAINSIRIDNDGSGVLIGGKDVAPYAPYTNAPWSKGKNPNEGWIDKAIQEALPVLKQALSGKMTKAEYEATMKKYNDERDRRAENYSRAIAERRDKI